MSLLSRLCKGAPLLLYLTIVHAWMLPTLFLLYVGGAVESWVFLATAFSAAATAVSSLFLGRRGGGGLDLLELFHRRGRLCAAVPVMYVASHMALVFVIFTSLYLYTTPVLVVEAIPGGVEGLGNYTAGSGGNVTQVVLHVRGLGNLAEGGRFIVIVKGQALGGSAGWILYAALWIASFYSAMVVVMALAWRLMWQSAELVRRAEVFYEKAREILS